MGNRWRVWLASQLLPLSSRAWRGDWFSDNSVGLLAYVHIVLQLTAFYMQISFVEDVEFVRHFVIYIHVCFIQYRCHTHKLPGFSYQKFPFSYGTCGIRVSGMFYIGKRYFSNLTVNLSAKFLSVSLLFPKAFFFFLVANSDPLWEEWTQEKKYLVLIYEFFYSLCFKINAWKKKLKIT